MKREATILVVDDNVDAAEMLSMLLEAAGYDVFCEHTPRRALERGRRLKVWKTNPISRLRISATTSFPQ